MQSYGELIQHRIQSGHCPFCHESLESYVDSNDTAYVVPARAPYNNDHVLICPKSHAISLMDLTSKELEDIRSLIIKRNQILMSKHSDLVMFVREGSVLGSTGKTVGHLHWHIVPHFTIQYKGSQESSDARVFMSDEQYMLAVRDLQTYISS